MSAISVLTLKEAIIPLTPSFLIENLRTTKLEHKWTTGVGANARDEYSKMYLPICDDPSMKELFLYVIDQFFDAAHSERLHLTTGTARYTKFRAVLGGAVRLSWQTLSDARAGKTVDTFSEDVHALVAEYLPETSYEDQLEFMRTATKPFNTDCETLGARLRVISRLARHLPGSILTPGDAPRPLYTSEDAFKRAFFQLMPSAWKVKFAESGHVLMGATYTMQNLIRFMAVQEALSKRGKRQRDERGGRGGRGYQGRGGSRGFGRGRGRGRGNYGNYIPRNNYGGNHGGSFGGSQGFRSPNPYLTPRGGGYAGGYSPGRYSGRGSYSGGRGSFSGRGNSLYGPGAAYTPRGRGRGSYSPGGRGPGPSLPTFTTDNRRSQDHYYHDPGQGADQYYADDQFYGEQEQFYGDETYYGDYPPQDQFFGEEQHGQPDAEMYHADDPNAQPDSQEPSHEDVHWLQDFGL